jgi:hypothetical protein
MNPRYRSFSGALIAVFAVPVFLGLTACLPSFPVPVGDPEKSRIDPYISGVWMIDENAFYIFEPYDKRTWLLSSLEIYEDEDHEDCAEKFEAGETADLESDEADIELDEYEQLVVDLRRYGSECFDGEREGGVVKVWRTKLGGEWFMTWEPIGGFDAEDGFSAKEWIVFKIDTSIPDELRLWMLSDEHDAWDVFEGDDGKDYTRRAVEKIIRKHADEKEMFEEEPMVLYRVLPEHYDLIESLIDSEW